MSFDGIIGGRPVRENWDYVPMDTYHADMRESSESAAGIITALRKRADDAERALALAVIAAGGSVEIDRYSLTDPKSRIETEIWRNDATGTVTIKARRIRDA